MSFYSEHPSVEMGRIQTILAQLKCMYLQSNYYMGLPKLATWQNIGQNSTNCIELFIFIGLYPLVEVEGINQCQRRYFMFAILNKFK